MNHPALPQTTLILQPYKWAKIFCAPSHHTNASLVSFKERQVWLKDTLQPQRTPASPSWGHRLSPQPISLSENLNRRFETISDALTKTLSDVTDLRKPTNQTRCIGLIAGALFPRGQKTMIFLP